MASLSVSVSKSHLQQPSQIPFFNNTHDNATNNDTDNDTDENADDNADDNAELKTILVIF